MIQSPYQSSNRDTRINQSGTGNGEPRSLGIRRDGPIRCFCIHLLYHWPGSKAPRKKNRRITDGHRSEGAQEGSKVGEVEYKGKLEAIWEPSIYCFVKTSESRYTTSIWGRGLGAAVEERTWMWLTFPKE